jgi:hypothetical protein
MKIFFEEKGTFLRHQKPQPQHWTNFALGKSYFNMAAVSSVRDNFLRVEFLINTDNSKEDFRKLKEKFEQQSYEQISKDLIWDEIPDKKMSWVYLKKEANVNNKSDWLKQHQWFMETLEKFDKFFRPKIKKL